MRVPTIGKRHGRAPEIDRRAAPVAPDQVEAARNIYRQLFGEEPPAQPEGNSATPSPVHRLQR
jgi:hypothetical protein